MWSQGPGAAHAGILGQMYNTRSVLFRVVRAEIGKNDKKGTQTNATHTDAA